MNVRTFKEIRRTYGYDEVAIAPGAITINPELLLFISDFEVAPPLIVVILGIMILLNIK